MDGYDFLDNTINWCDKNCADVKETKTMGKTDMELLMEKWGIELDEKINAEYADGHIIKNISFQRLKAGCIYLMSASGTCDVLFHELVNGTAKIIKKPWIPEAHGIYFYVTKQGKIESTYYDTTYDYSNSLIGNCYRTKAEAEQHIDYWKHVYTDMPQFKEVEKIMPYIKEKAKLKELLRAQDELAAIMTDHCPGEYGLPILATEMPCRKAGDTQCRWCWTEALNKLRGGEEK